ncbi:MAG: cytochrome-c peroxidase [Bacteroidia bacterium]|nr:cytochrome-c peroxidase [Bacteroidia bacterium]HQU99746.1 cytochrome c peroxidase [Bacteroidia bacterium]
MKKLLVIIIITLIIVVVNACKKEGDTLPPFNPTPLTIKLPGNLPVMNIPASNPTTVEGVALGRMLYYDKIMHPNGSMACASCHLQSEGFTKKGTNILPHINLGYGNKFLWNGEIEGTLEDAMIFEVEDFFKTNISKLQNDDTYPLLFYKAFGSTEIDSKKCAYALAQFLRTLVSGNSKFDKYLRHELTLTADELTGLTIFFSERGDCFHCHSLSLMGDGNRHNIGLDSIFNGVNAGYYNVTANPADLGKFKTPSLRNCGIRTSFMHDGRYTKLDEVIEHYNSKVKNSASLDPVLTKPGKAYGLNLTNSEKEKLKAFLLTLTDTVYLSDTAFASPF